MRESSKIRNMTAAELFQDLKLMDIRDLELLKAIIDKIIEEKQK